MISGKREISYLHELTLLFKLLLIRQRVNGERMGIFPTH